MTDSVSTDFFTEYMSYVGLDTSEAPAIYHRWTCASILGALLGRQCSLPFGHQVLYPNQYIMLMGEPGARKGSAMGVGKSLLKQAGYSRFAADKTSKERFLMDMKQVDELPGLEGLEMMGFDDPAETFVMSGEFTDFIGEGNMEFVTMLTNLWDNLSTYKQPKITGKSVVVTKPTVNLVGANTVAGFSRAFPPEALGNGFLSRTLMIYGEATGVRIAWPEPPDLLKTEMLVQRLKSIRENIQGEMTIHPDAHELGKIIYAEEPEHPVDDSRFAGYATRRYIHMLKLSMIIAAGSLSKTVEVIHMIRANTMLTAAEKKMPQALGEYGKSRHSDVANAIIGFLKNRVLPANAADIYKVVARDIKMSELGDILNSLKAGDRIQVEQIRGKTGYLLNYKEAKSWPDALLDMEWLTTFERNL